MEYSYAYVGTMNKTI